MDHVLRPYLQATEESEREQRLEELLLFHAAPEIRFTLRQRLRFHVSQQGVVPRPISWQTGGFSNQGPR